MVKVLQAIVLDEVKCTKQQTAVSKISLTADGIASIPKHKSGKITLILRESASHLDR
jgi:hypothetical protein